MIIRDFFGLILVGGCAPRARGRPRTSRAGRPATRNILTSLKRTDLDHFDTDQWHCRLSLHAGLHEVGHDVDGDREDDGAVVFR